ncbi:MAG: tetratricopeptide repeat protein [Bacteroidota bacterium]
MKGKHLQLILVGTALVITGVIYTMPSQVNVKQEEKENKVSQNANGFSEEQIFNQAKSLLDSNQVKKLAFFEAALKNNGAKDTALLDQFGRFWDQVGVPAAAAIWFEKKSAILRSEQGYLEAAYRYFDAFKMTEDSLFRSMMVGKAIANYQLVLEKNPSNLNAKTDLGVCYAEGTSEPMKGILLLREVVSIDPNHEMAQFNLAMLSIKSGQLDKAIDRLNTVLKINPKRTDVYFYLGQVYSSKGDKTKAIENLKNFVSKTDDPNAAAEVKKMITALEKSPA